MDEASHFDQVSRFGPSAIIMVMVIAGSFVITAIHTYQELKGAGAPLWRNFGAIVGVKLPDFIGFLAFSLFLTLGLWGLALTGMAGWIPLFGRANPDQAAFALGALIGARLSDTVVSHVLLHAIGYRPNPGLSSTPLYVADAIFVAYAFNPGMAANPTLTTKGIAAGVLVFVVVLPGLWVIGNLVPTWRRERWERWNALPSWASTGD